MYDIVIVGAGVCGCSIARELSKKQANILVVEKEEDVCCGTSKANSALIHAGYDAKHGTLMAKLNVEGSRLMPQLAKDLDIPYKANGALVVMVNEEDRPALEALYQNGLANGVENLRIIEREELVALEPNISPQAVAALYAPTSAIICPFTLTYALAENAAKNGVTFQFDTLVTDIKPSSHGWKLETNRGSIETKVVVNAAGVHADELHNMVSQDTMTIIPRRGDYFLLDRSCQGFVTRTVFQLPGKLGKGVLVAPTIHGNTLVGPTAIDTEDKDSVATTAEGLDLVRQRSGVALNNIPLNQTITTFAGLRAHEKRHQFFIEEIAPGFVDCAGIESPGLVSSPAIGIMVADIVSKKGNFEKKENFIETRKGITHFNSLSNEEKNKLIKENPLYGHIICRCEKVTEGEIVEAIKSPIGAKSIDGVKRRVRAGLGRCQGGFCSPKIIEILARELNVSPLTITKCGKGSEIVIGYDKETF